MNIDLTKYKVVLGDNVLRALALIDVIYGPNQHPDPTNPRHPKSVKPDYLVLLIINADGNLVSLCDKAEKFQFVPDLQRGGGLGGV